MKWIWKYIWFFLQLDKGTTKDIVLNQTSNATAHAWWLVIERNPTFREKVCSTEREKKCKTVFEKVNLASFEMANLCFGLLISDVRMLIDNQQEMLRKV